MLDHNLRRWPNVKPASGQCVLFPGNCHLRGMISRHVIIVFELEKTTGPTQINTFVDGCLKGLAHAKIIKKSVILFWLLNMTI